MSEHFINLNCANCGAKLDVYDDMERFACGYCRTELIVQRRGGTVALKAVTEAIKKVQIGTDKTAAELALVRLAQNSTRLNKELERLTFERIKAKPMNRGQVFASLIVGMSGVMSLIMGVVDFQNEIGLFFFGLFTAGGGLPWFITAWKASKSKLILVENQILEKQAEIAEVESRMAEQRKIVDSTD